MSALSNNIIINSITILNMLNIIKNRRENTHPSIITIILIAIFYYFYDFSLLNVQKNAMLISIVALSFLGPLMESIIIHYTNGESWKYGYPYKNWYVPLWLFPGYGMLAMSSIHIYKSFLN
jgi:hypothetical protein